ncbi:MAG TPA: DnaB-like helicase C-terminal domain-containing protein [Xanthobacteraceae bacterium]|nr:DnaB-like helicase C-terminal domain-containing protein [Xanthobacteraceae bacterium]
MSRDIVINEQMFLGCLLRSPNTFWQINNIVTADMFTVQHHRDIFSAMREVAEVLNGQPTMAALKGRLNKEYDDVGPTDAILQALHANAMEAGSATDYADFIAENASNNRLRRLLQWADKEARAGQRLADDLIGEISQRLQGIAATASPLRPVPIGELMGKALRQATTAQSGGVVSHLTTGLSSLDEILGVISGGDLGFIIAAQGDGKSALAAQIGMHAAISGRPVLYVQLEMSGEQMGARELANLSEITVRQIHEGAFTAFDRERLLEVERQYNTVPFHVVAAPQVTVREIGVQALQMKRTRGLGLLIVDQLDKIQAVGKHANRFDRMAELTADLKRLALSLDVPTIVLAQRTRGAQRNPDPVPGILDADAPSIERDADWVLGLWQKINWMRRNKPDERAGAEASDNWAAKMRQAAGMAEAIVLKHRRQKTFEQCEMRFEGATMRFEEI